MIEVRLVRPRKVHDGWRGEGRSIKELMITGHPKDGAELGL